MKKILNGFMIALSFVFISNTANAYEFYGIGATLMQDPYGLKKVVVMEVLPDTPAAKAGLKIGEQIVAVDDIKITRKSSMPDTIGKIRGDKDTIVTIKTKDGFKKHEYKIKRDKITVPDTNQDERFNSHWFQIAHPCYRDTKCISKEVAKKLSLKYRRTILPMINYWADRRSKFTLGYCTCLNQYSPQNQEMCLINLMNREVQETQADKQLYKFLRDKR